MANVNAFKCNLFTPNTGFSSCTINPGLLLGYIAVPRGTRFTLSQLATLPALLATGAQNSLPGVRYFPIGRFIAVTDSSTETQIETTDYGVQLVSRDGTYIWTGRTTNGNLCYFKTLRKFHNRQDAYDMIAVFKNGLMLAYSPNATTGAAEYTGLRPSLINVQPFKIATGSAAEQYWISVQFSDASQISDTSLLVQTSGDILASVSGITDVDIQNNAVFNTTPAGSIDVLPIEGCGGLSLLDAFGSTLNNASLWTATNTATGGGITITGVSMVNGKYRIQQDVTDPDYPAIGGKVTLTMGTVPTLYTAGVIGYESNSVTLTRPA